ncbi:MAG TPA: hypothetical protein VLC95_02900 [Anaerolineae bacterium]|nr:hypothetical protein [Anaerolineae bacterium]
MPGFAVRDVECILCRKQFSLMTADFIVPWTLICDECLAQVWALEGEDLTEHLAAAHAATIRARSEEPAASPVPPHPFDQEIAAHLQEMKQRWTTAHDAIRARHNPF